MSEHENKSDRDLLIQVVNDVCWLKKIVGNHLQHHSKLLFWVLGIMGTIVAGLITALVSIVITN